MELNELLALPIFSNSPMAWLMAIGVAIATLALLLAVAPLLLWTRGQSWGQRFRLATSVALIAIGAFWFVERIVDNVA